MLYSEECICSIPNKLYTSNLNAKGGRVATPDPANILAWKPMNARSRVLVVDDHEMVRRAVCGLLETQDDIDIVCEACNGEDAVSFAKEHRPDIVVLDITMPVMNGFEAALLLKKKFPEMQ